MVYETKEQIIRRKKMARYRFRAIIRKARLNSFWLSELDDLSLGDNVQKNITIILKRRQKMRGVLTIHDKTSLRKPPTERTNEEVLHLKKLFDELPCFSSLAPNFRRKLVEAVVFQYFEKDRLLLMEGHKSHSMFFILTGEILISKSLLDHEGNAVNIPVNILSSGDHFGHVGLIYDIARNASAATQTDCELLCLYKEDFDEILKEAFWTKHESIKQAIHRFEYFKNFSEQKITECCVISKIEEFDPLQTIYSSVDITNFSYFVLSGNCMILQCLKIRENGKGKCSLVVTKNATESAMTNYQPHESNLSSMIDTSSSDVKHQFVDVGTYNCGAVFGIGEEMETRAIIARSVVQCLLIPRYWLFQKSQNIGNVWQRIKIFLDSSIPSQLQLFENHLANQKWKKYKKKTFGKIMRDNGITASMTQYYNIPIVCRIENN